MRKTRSVLRLAAAATMLLFAADAARADGLCGEAERSVFTCRVKAKLVSLCASPARGTVSEVAYRFGVPGKLELVRSAGPNEPDRFHATAFPASPDASLRQIWFDNDGATYIITQCVGGDCTRDAGLAVIKGGRTVYEAGCDREPDDSVGFRSGLVRFGSDSDDTVSATPLLTVKDERHPVERFFVRRRLR